MGEEVLSVEETQVWGELQDLYDFNHDSVGAAQNAAILQIGHGNGDAKHDLLHLIQPSSFQPRRDLAERTKAFALRVIRLYSALPRTTEAQVLGKQELRSGTSVGANYREALPSLLPFACGRRRTPVPTTSRSSSA